MFNRTEQKRGQHEGLLGLTDSLLSPRENKPKLKMVGEDGNAFFIIGRAQRAWKKAGLPQDEWEQIRDKMTGGDYNDLIRTAMTYFDAS